MADISLYYTESGEGFPLIFLHGNGEDSGYFVHQTEFFSAYFRTIAIDTRGHGRSPRGEGEFSLVRFADDLHDFMLSHGIEKAHILGFSDGGNIALYFALKYPSMVGRLVLCGANISPSGIKRSVQIPIEIGYSIAKLFAKKERGRKGERRNSRAYGERAGYKSGGAFADQSSDACHCRNEGYGSPQPYGAYRGEYSLRRACVHKGRPFHSKQKSV